MDKAIFVSLSHEPEIVGTSSGFSKNRYPKFFYGGGNGTYVAPLVPATTTLVLETEDGEQHRYNIYKELKAVSLGARFTKRFISELEQRMQGEIFTLNDHLGIIDLEEILDKYFNQC